MGIKRILGARLRTTATLFALMLLLTFPCSSLAEPLPPLSTRSSFAGPEDGFSPFGENVSRPKYFPDETEKRVEEALMDAYLGNAGALEDHYRFLLEQDRERTKARRPVTGLSDNLLYLSTGLVKNRDAYVSALQNTLEAPLLETALEGTVRYELKNDPFHQGQAALKGDKGNKTTSVANTFLRPLNLATLGLSLFVPAAIETAVNAALRFRDFSRFTDEERMALSAYQEFVARYPHSQLSAKAQREIARIQQKKRDHELARLLERGQADLEAGDLDEAAETLKEALELDPGSETVARALAEVEREQAQREAARSRSLTVAQESAPALSEEQAAYEDILLTWYLDGPSSVLREGQAFLSRYPQSPLADEVDYLIAMAQEAQGDYTRSRPLLEDLARKRRRSNRGEKARYALANPPYDWKDEMSRAERQRRRETLRYALLGERFAQENMVVGSSELALEGLSALETLGIFNLMTMGYRSISTLIQSPISHQRTIELGESYLQRFPDLAASGEIHEELAKAYEKEGDLERAMLHYELAGKLTEEEKARYREKIAQGLLRYAEEKGEKEETRAEQRFYLELLLRNYPETQAGRKAMPDLVKLVRAEAGLLRISKRELMENPAFFGANGINIKPELLDGNRKNREIADAGISFINENLLKITYDTEQGPEEQLYRMNEDIFKRLQIVRFQEQYRTALTRKGDPRSQKNQKLAYELGGDLSLRDVDLEAKLFRGDTGFFLGGDHRSPYAGFEFPLPLLDQVVPLNFKLSIRPQGVTLDPALQKRQLPSEQAPLYGE